MKKLVIAIFVLSLSCAPAMGAYYTFDDGGGDMSWHTGSNWNPDIVGEPLFVDDCDIDLGAAGAQVVVSGAGAVHNVKVSHWYLNNTLTVNPGASLDIDVNLTVAGAVGGAGAIYNYGDMGDPTDPEGNGEFVQCDIGAYGAGLFQQGSTSDPDAGSLKATYMNIPGPWGATGDASGQFQHDGGVVQSWDFRLTSFLEDIPGSYDFGSLGSPTSGARLDVRRADAQYAEMGNTYKLEDYISLGYMTTSVPGASLVVDDLAVPGHLLVYAVPEPMTLSLLGLGGLALIRRRRA